jgi:hypothetical protein
MFLPVMFLPHKFGSKMTGRNIARNAMDQPVSAPATFNTLLKHE